MPSTTFQKFNKGSDTPLGVTYFSIAATTSRTSRGSGIGSGLILTASKVLFVGLDSLSRVRVIIKFIFALFICRSARRTINSHRFWLLLLQRLNIY